MTTSACLRPREVDAIQPPPGSNRPLGARAACVLLALTVAGGCDETVVTTVAVATLEVSPSELSVREGDRESLSFIAKESTGRVLQNRGVEWSSDDPAIATVSADGTVEGRSVGQTRIYATSEGARGSAMVTVLPRPIIRLSVGAVDFHATAGDPSPREAEVKIENGGSGSLGGLTATAASAGGAPPSWLEAQLGSGTAPTQLRLRVSTAGLNPGKYEATVAVSAASSSIEPAQLSVRVEVVEPPPRIAASPRFVQLGARVGSSDAATASVSIQNEGGGTLSSLSVAVVHSPGAGTGWLSADLSRSRAPATVSLHASARDLSPGVYFAVIRISSPVAAGGPVEVEVRFEVTAPLLVHPNWPVSVPPGAIVTDLEARPDRLRYRLETDLGFDAVYDRLHPELEADGWKRRDIDRNKDKIEAEYRKGRLDLDVTVERDKGRVKVDLEIDD